jgi:membrane-associated protein
MDAVALVHTGNLALLGALDPRHLVDTFGVAGVMVILFAETGLLIGFFLPGDSLLFVAGAAAAGIAGLHVPLGWLLVGAAVAAILGAQVGYWLGRRAGPPLFDKPDARLFKRKYVERADYIINRFGTGKAVVVARFVPIVRTFLNPLAGVIDMPRREFTLWNVVGGIMWTTSMIMLGYYVGNVRFVKDNIELLVVAVVAISVTPILVEVVRERRRTAETAEARELY